MAVSTFKDVSVNNKTKFVSAVFLYMFIGIAITAAVSALVGFIFTSVFPIAYTSDPMRQTYSNVYLGLMIGSSILTIILMFWIMKVAFKGEGNLAIPFTIYAIVMGVLISSFTMFIPFQTIAISFGITCIAFLAMFLIGWFVKANFSVIAMIATGIILGAGLIALFNLIWSLISPRTFVVTYWIVSYAIFFAVMLITIVDIARVKSIAEHGEASSNVILYCAFTLYVDFIYIFIRILAIVARSRS